MTENGRPSDEIVRRFLGAVLGSATFARSERLRSFLSYVVENELSGKAPQLKGYSIGIDVFGRSPGFDAGNDPLVRVQAGKLRKLLEQYYETEGMHDAWRIRIPIGSYVPEYEAVLLPAENGHEPEQRAAEANIPRKRKRERNGWLPEPVSSPLALFSLLPLFFLAPSVYPEASSTAIAKAEFVLAGHEQLTRLSRSLPGLSIQRCWPANADCAALADAISASAGFHKTVQLVAPRAGTASDSLSYSIRIDNQPDGRSFYVRLMHERTGSTVYAKHLWRSQLAHKAGISHEAVAFTAHALAANGLLYRHAIRTGAASSLMQCLAGAVPAIGGIEGPRTLPYNCRTETPEALVQASESGGASAFILTR